ncbi:uncharacterized protein LOC133879675 [Alnus glutinosa]|uniref:uncharacterized protein LOC133879675 n=1 Tax=Alnus glutinosa TaxID=3517 RepID=UPI002D78A2C7|nr:uncharacterized protein LOC133879675 [Alnus glutinosa]XP_062174335.1 uncharacterized protein LOC133879675 [Alnus glutinosa]XP_062174336.1 uncharacterized protein LOC133879675 [Alnus glutinosa]XP_062174337.1 uncharacterized protein LOC133879675 [Alnus glutinosa]
MEIKGGLSAGVLQVLDKDNYVAWSVQVKTYLMARDLWDTVEATTEPPKQEDDEAAFKAWSEKNSTALHVLKVSCGQHALAMIMEINSAKIAWNTLAVVLQVLEKDNYVTWTVRVKTYLMAHDLWDVIEATTEPPSLEDDEAAFKAWSMKNSTALNVIQISCGPDTFSNIIQISSAKIAWDTLTKMFLRVLEKNNYEDWSVQIKTYLMAHDLWEIIEATTEPPRQEDDEAAFKDWRNKNFMALNVIQFSCGPDTSSEIIHITLAKIAWDTLAKKYAVPTGSGENEALIEALKSGNWNTAEEFLKRQPDARSAKITSVGETALSFAVAAGHEHIVEKLVDVMSVEELAIPDIYGNTALVVALNAGNYRMAACMLRKNNNLVSIEDEDKRIPVIQAIENGDIELTRYLYSLTPLEDLTKENGANGATLCILAIYSRSLDIALDLIQKRPQLALALDKEDRSPLYALAESPNAFLSGDGLMFWKRWIYKYCIHIQPTSAIEEIRLSIQNNQSPQSNQVKTTRSVLALLHKPFSNLLNFLGIQHLYEMKLVHAQSHELLDLMCKEVLKSNENQWKKGGVYDAVTRSVEKGNFQYFFDIIRAIPNLIWTNIDKDITSLFSLAVLYRQANIFSLIYPLGVKKAMTCWINKKGNSILHMAGMTGASIELNRIPGAALQMQRELQWFKEVESMVQPQIKESFNIDDFTPRQLFTKNHKDLMKEGEKWMKGTATSCTVVGTLIVTIMFAAAFTVPGGNNQNTGFPIFLDKRLFMLFIIFDVLSLFSSTTSVVMFLGILTSRYAEDDFLESLPRKMIIGLSTLFFSIAAMMIAFSTALLIMLQEQYSWIIIPVICFASVPVALFVLMQFPLLVDMFKSTYGPGIFDKKIKKWV